MCAVEMGSGDKIYVPSLMKTGTGIREIIRFCLRNERL
jgi:hypothetical protein